MSVLLASVLKPFVALVILVPIRVAVSILHARMPDSRLKRLLFLPLVRGGRGARRGAGDMFE